MAMPPQQSNAGVYLPTTYSFPGEDQEQFKVRIYQTINSIINALNLKETAQFLDQEFVTGQMFFNPTDSSPLKQRNVFREVVDMGALAAGATTVAHGLTIGTTWSFVNIYGTASNTAAGGNYYPLPWASAAGATNIELKVNNVNVIITNNSGVVFPVCYVVLEYLKN